MDGRVVTLLAGFSGMALFAPPPVALSQDQIEARLDELNLPEGFDIGV